MPLRKGSDLSPTVQAHLLRTFIGRFTREHIPQWATRDNGPSYRVQFASDQDWLDNTLFHVTLSGRLDERFKHCESTPTWPDGDPMPLFQKASS